jgi:hypothetical protein
MEREQLRRAQAPPKERYREQPDAALVTLSAAGELGEGVSCVVFQTIAGSPQLSTSFASV